MLRSLLFALLLISPSLLAATELSFQPVQDENYLLLDVKLNKFTVANAVDAYEYQGKLLIAVEPLFDGLQLKYQLRQDSIIVWKDEQQINLNLNRSSNSEFLWSLVDDYLLLDANALAQLFDVAVSYDKSVLKAQLISRSYQFPIQIVLEQQRQRDRANRYSGRETTEIPDLTIPDRYQLWTLPHGLVSMSASTDHLDNNDVTYSVQTTSDLLYHSASITVNDGSNIDSSARINLSRYKTSPDDKVLGMFDLYSVGDINGYSDSLTTTVQSGVGFKISKAPDYYRQRNVNTEITETAPPGWDAELYLNGELLTISRVPSDGNLIFQDVETHYGANHYQIKLFGPYGETDVRDKFLSVDRNALGEGEQAYRFYALSPQQKLIGGDGWDQLSLKDFGLSYDYGISDSWQTGISVNMIENTIGEEQRFATLKNALAMPGLLFENEISLADNDGYAQISTLSGNAFGQDTFTLSYRSADDFDSGRISAQGINWQQLSANYIGRVKGWGYNLGVNGLKFGTVKDLTFNARVNTNIGGMSVSNTLFHRRYEDDGSVSNSTSGSLLTSGAISERVRFSGTLNYNFEQDDILDNVTGNFTWRQDNGISHNLRAQYSLIDTDSKWRVSHSLGWYRDDFQLTFLTNYDELDRWSVAAGIRFFLGYDYRNRNLIMSNHYSQSSATLDVHAYLDRNPNGWRDELDYDLPGITFEGNRNWQKVKTGENGRAVLPGVTPYAPFTISAKGQYGVSTLQKDYVVFTHPGAHLEVNMPFYLSNDISGFVMRRSRSGDTLPLRGAKLNLTNTQGQLIKSIITDSDGFYEFVGIEPGQYQVAIELRYMREAGYSSDVVGYRLATPLSGGFVELDNIVLRRVLAEGDEGTEGIASFSISPENSDQIYWPEDESMQHHYFNLPGTRRVSAQESASQPDQLPVSIEQRTAIPDQLQQRQSGGIQPENREQMPIALENRSSLPVPPESRQQLPQALPVGETSGFVPRRESAAINPESRNELPFDMPGGERVPDYPVADIDSGFVIQFGIFSQLSTANSLRARLPAGTMIEEGNFGNKLAYRVVSRAFESSQQAYQFAYSSLPGNIDFIIKEIGQVAAESNAEDYRGYVVQYAATLSSSSLAAIAADYSQFGPVYLAQKQVNGVNWYCLVSQRFADKGSAEQLKSQLDGAWVVEAVQFTFLQAL